LTATNRDAVRVRECQHDATPVGAHVVEIEPDLRTASDVGRPVAHPTHVARIRLVVVLPADRSNPQREIRR
jgi:hypothetical protein